MLKLRKDSEVQTLHKAGKVMHVLSMGAGVQTTAMLIKYWERYKNGYVIFADTGDEQPETYEYVKKYLKPFCEQKGIRWVTVKHHKYNSIMEWCMIKKVLPIKKTRECTRDFKIRPINRFIRSRGASMKMPVYVDIGFSVDEWDRFNPDKHHGPAYVKNQYPLLDANISREDCYAIIKQNKWPVPVKSGCDFCPFKNRKSFVELHIKRPARFLKVVAMEENDKNFPKYPLINKPLRSILGIQSLGNWVDDPLPLSSVSDSCDSGHCML